MLGSKVVHWLRTAVVVSLIAVAGSCATTADLGDGPVGLADVVDEHGEIEAPRQGVPKRIILFIGDGMGLSAVTASSYAAGSPLAMMEMPHFALMTTHEYEFLTTDSAASATAIATGVKSHFGAISVRPGTGRDKENDESAHLRTLFDAAREAGWKTGLVAPVRITHATPAPFGAHRHYRRSYEEIALDLSQSGIDVMLGAGSKYFRDRRDGRDLLEEMEARGYVVATEADQLRREAETASSVIALMHEGDMPGVDEGGRAMELEEMVTQALSILDRDDPEGFIVMVEGAFIDWGGHALDGKRVVSETIDMDRAVKRALKYARGRDDTLVVVTADHETAGMDVIDGPKADRYLTLLGGEENARELTIPDDTSRETRRELASPFAHLELGEPRHFGPAEASDNRLTTTFGYFSAASRATWDGQGRFSAIHTPIMVPLLAEGPGAQEVVRQRDNADLGRRLMAWIDGEERAPTRTSVALTPAGDDVPENIIVLVADGLGAAAVTAVHYLAGPSSMLEMSQMAALSTHGLDRLVNDRWAAATALATGHRTRAGALAMAPMAEGEELEAVPTVFDGARQTGRAIGLVVDGPLDEGVSPAFFARSPQMQAVEDMDRQLEEVNLAFFGRAESSGARSERRRLAQVTAEAIRELKSHSTGFFLLVDGSGLRRRLDALERGQGLVDALRDLDEAVAAALEFSRDDGRTLVLVTASRDHTLSIMDEHYGFHRGDCRAVRRCGGDFELEWHGVDPSTVYLAEGLADPELRGTDRAPALAFQYTWMVQHAGRVHQVGGTHSANFVPLFADGPGAGNFKGFMEQPEIGEYLLRWSFSEPASAQVGSARRELEKR